MNKSRNFFLTGLIAMIGLIVLGVVFFKERIAFGDTAYQAVLLLIDQRPSIVWIRAGSMIPQLIPLTAIWLHAGLRTVMILHSVSFLFFFLIIYLIAYRYSDKKMLFLVIPLYLILITNEVFYWPQSELQQGMVWLGLYAVLLFEGRWAKLSPPLSVSIHFLFILWIQFFHPLIFFPIAFLLVYYYDSEGVLFSRRSFYVLGACLLSFGIRSIVGALDVYEKGKLNLSYAIKNNLPHFFSLDSVQVFIRKIPTAYLGYIVFLGAGFIWLLIHKKYLKALSLAVFSIGYWVLIMISSSEDARFYTENMLLPLGFIAALPIVVDIIPTVRPAYAIIAGVVVIGLRLGGIYEAHMDYTAHYRVYEPYLAYIQKNKLGGVFVDEKLINKKTAIMTWASGYETMLITALNSPDSCRIVQTAADPDRYGWGVANDSLIVTVFGVWGKHQVPQRYFSMPAGKYEIIKSHL